MQLKNKSASNDWLRVDEVESYENFNPEDLVVLSYTTKPNGGFVHRIPQGIRAIHLPTGTVVTCETERSQHRNRHLALTELWQKVQGMPSYAELSAQVEVLRVAALNAISFMSGGQAKAKLRDAYDATPAQCLAARDAEIKAQAGRDGFIAGYFHCRNEGFQFEDELENSADAYANQLRQQAKRGDL